MMDATKNYKEDGLQKIYFDLWMISSSSFQNFIDTYILVTHQPEILQVPTSLCFIHILHDKDKCLSLKNWVANGIRACSLFAQNSMARWEQGKKLKIES